MTAVLNTIVKTGGMVFSIVVTFLPLCGEAVGSKAAGKLCFQNLNFHTPNPRSLHREGAKVGYLVRS